MSSGARIVVLGGAGAMGRIVVHDLFETAPLEVEVVIADRDEAAARALARRYRARRFGFAVADASRLPSCKRALAGAAVVVNCTRHEFHLTVMAAALACGSHYLDLGGLFHQTREQLPLGPRFEKQGLLAVLGIGAAPGITNLLAWAGAEGLERIDSIACLVAGVDRAENAAASAPLSTSYSLETVLDEASLPAAVFRDGQFGFVPALSGADEVRFPPPVGVARPAHTLHSEVATLPLSFAARGIQQVSFKIAFPEALVAELKMLEHLGLLSPDPIPVGRAQIAPRAMLRAILAAQPAAVAPARREGGPPDDYEILRVVVRGVRAGRPVETTLDCHVAGIPAWGFGVDVDTGCPASIAAQLLVSGTVTARGVRPPEQVFAPDAFFRALLQRGMIVRSRQTSPPTPAKGTSDGPKKRRKNA